MFMIVLTKQDQNVGIDPFDLKIIYDNPQELDVVNALAKKFAISSSIQPLISPLSETDPSEQFFVIVDHTTGSLLLSLDEKKLGVLKSLFAHAKGVLWITFGASENSNNAGAGVVSGIIRTLRWESGGMAFVTCDMEVEDLSKPELGRVVSKIYTKAFSKSTINSPVRDFEYAVRNGQIMIPRFVEDKLANETTMAKSSKRELQEQPLWQENSCLRLEMEHVGLLDTFQFVHSATLSNESPLIKLRLKSKRWPMPSDTVSNARVNPDDVSKAFMDMGRDIRVSDLTALIEHHVRAGSKAVAQVAIGFKGFPPFDARFVHVAASLQGLSRTQDSGDQAESLEPQIAAAGGDAVRLLPVILEAFKRKLGRLLALKAEDVHEDDSLAGQGLDSLVAVEIRNWWRKEVGANMTVFDIFDGKLSVQKVVEEVVRGIAR